MCEAVVEIERVFLCLGYELVCSCAVLFPCKTRILNIDSWNLRIVHKRRNLINTLYYVTADYILPTFAYNH